MKCPNCDTDEHLKQMFQVWLVAPYGKIHPYGMTKKAINQKRVRISHVDWNKGFVTVWCEKCGWNLMSEIYGEKDG